MSAKQSMASSEQIAGLIRRRERGREREREGESHQRRKERRGFCGGIKRRNKVPSESYCQRECTRAQERIKLEKRCKIKRAQEVEKEMKRMKNREVS